MDPLKVAILAAFFCEYEILPQMRGPTHVWIFISRRLTCFNVW